MLNFFIQIDADFFFRSPVNEGNDLEMDMAEFESLFTRVSAPESPIGGASRVKGSGVGVNGKSGAVTSDGPEKRRVVSLLPAKKSMNIGITLARLRKPHRCMDDLCMAGVCCRASVAHAHPP